MAIKTQALPRGLDLEVLVQNGELARYDWYRGMNGDDLLYLVFPSGRELHISASLLMGKGRTESILKVTTPVRIAKPVT